MITLRGMTLLALVAGSATGTSLAQTKAKAKSSARTSQLRFAKLPEVPASIVDSFLIVKADSQRVAVMMVIDNRCGFRPKGRYSLAGDTVFVVIRYRAGAPESAICPGAPWLQVFAASTDTLRSGRYLVRVVVESGSRQVPTRIYRSQLDI